MQGWLEKEGGGVVKSWQWRWFVIKGARLVYYKDESDVDHPHGDILLTEIRNVTKTEHSNRRYCLTLVADKKGGKTYYLAAQTDFQRDQWFDSIIPKIEGGDSYVKSKVLYKYATAEIFLNRGVRLSGDVGLPILKKITEFRSSGQVAKTRDEKGWFCDQDVSLNFILNVFSANGWCVDAIYPAKSTSSISSFEGDLFDVIKVILYSKRTVFASIKTKEIVNYSSNTLPIIRSGSAESGRGRVHSDNLSSERSRGSSDAASSVSVFSEAWVEGVDQELVDLMEEFEIPTSLLEKSRVTQQIEALVFH